jgi:hypothetical protein
MPNGGSISCSECTFGRDGDGRCDIFGTEVTPFLLCRAFRRPKQSHTEARRHWPMLNRLDKGVVYEIENSYPSAGVPPRPVFRMLRITG